MRSIPPRSDVVLTNAFWIDPGQAAARARAAAEAATRNDSASRKKPSVSRALGTIFKRRRSQTGGLPLGDSASPPVLSAVNMAPADDISAIKAQLQAQPNGVSPPSESQKEQQLNQQPSVIVFDPNAHCSPQYQQYYYQPDSWHSYVASVNGSPEPYANAWVSNAGSPEPFTHSWVASATEIGFDGTSSNLSHELAFHEAYKANGAYRANQPVQYHQPIHVSYEPGYLSQGAEPWRTSRTVELLSPPSAIKTTARRSFDSPPQPSTPRLSSDQRIRPIEDETIANSILELYAGLETEGNSSSTRLRAPPPTVGDEAEPASPSSEGDPNGISLLEALQEPAAELVPLIQAEPARRSALSLFRRRTLTSRGSKESSRASKEKPESSKPTEAAAPSLNADAVPAKRLSIPPPPADIETSMPRKGRRQRSRTLDTSISLLKPLIDEKPPMPLPNGPRKDTPWTWSWIEARGVKV